MSRLLSRALPGLAVASLVANIALIVTGGTVRLTASGLGCPTWPRCTESSLVNTPEMGIHGFVEFGNRLLTIVLAAVALATFVAALRARPVRPGVRPLAAALFFGIPAQAIIGGITVLTALNPWVVMLHLLLSMALVALATVLVARTREPRGRDDAAVWTGLSAVPPAAPLRALALAVAATAGLAIYLGAVVTGSGPHAGDRSARRTGLDPALVSQLHADSVFLLLGLTVGLLVAVHVAGGPAGLARAVQMLLGVEIAQGAIGYVQYFTGLPVVLVNLHMLGAALLVVAVTRVVLAAAARPARPWHETPAVARLPVAG